MTVVEMPAKGKGPGGSGPNGGNGGGPLYAITAAALREYKSNTGRNWDEISTELGYSRSTVSLFAAEKYPAANAQQIIATVEKFLATIAERRNLITETKFVNTSIARSILAMIHKAEIVNKIAVIATESGTGKTTTLQHYYAEHPRAVYLRGNPTFHTKAASTWPLQVEIAQALDIPASSKGVKTVLYQAIRNTLRNSGRVVMIDEAQFLEAAQIDLVRCLYEEARVPIILAGNEHLYERAGAFNSTASFVQFNRRVLRARYGVKDIMASDVTLIAEQFDIEIGRDAEELLVDQAHAPGGFGRLTTVLLLAQLLRSGNGKVRKEHVLAAIKEASGGDR